MKDQKRIYQILSIIASVVLFILVLYACEKVEPERIAKVATESVSDIQCNTSVASGFLIDVPDEGVTDHGHCWSVAEDPNISNPCSHLGERKTKGNFNSNLNELIPGTLYHVRAYAQTGDQVTYGENITFTTSAASLPSISTYEASSITMNSAICGGEVLSDGGYPVTARGICWNTTGSPTAEQNPVSSGTGLGSFDSHLTGLDSRTTYYVKAFASNELGTSLGNEIVFSTSDLPSVQTVEVTGTTPNSVSVVGKVTDGGDIDVTERGFCWDVGPGATIDGNHVPSGYGIGEFTGTIEELSPATQFYIRAYATNINGTVYGNDIAVVTSFSDERDGKIYPVVLIGDQYWMAANLNYGNYLSSTENQSENEIIEKFCFGDNEDNCELYGGYYTWSEMMQYVTTESARGVCPDGWHVPSDEEWKTMEMTLGMSQSDADDENWRGTDEGGKLKLQGTDIWQSPNEGATNESGFSAMPGGYYDITTYNDFVGVNTTATFWVSTEAPDAFTSYYRTLDYLSAQIYRSPGYQGNSTPVRCVKD